MDCMRPFPIKKPLSGSNSLGSCYTQSPGKANSTSTRPSSDKCIAWSEQLTWQLATSSDSKKALHQRDIAASFSLKGSLPSKRWDPVQMVDLSAPQRKAMWPWR